MKEIKVGKKVVWRRSKSFSDAAKKHGQGPFFIAKRRWIRKKMCFLYSLRGIDRKVIKNDDLTIAWFEAGLIQQASQQ